MLFRSGSNQTGGLDMASSDASGLQRRSRRSAIILHLLQEHILMHIQVMWDITAFMEIPVAAEIQPVVAEESE